MKKKTPKSTTPIFTDEQLAKIKTSPSLEDRLKWIVNNQHLANRLEPEMTARIKESISKTDPIFSANMIQSVPNTIEEFLKTSSSLSAPKRKSDALDLISLINAILRPEGFSTEQEGEAVESVRASLEEYAKLLEGILKPTASASSNLPVPAVGVKDGIEIKHCLLFLYGQKKILNKSAFTKRIAASGWTQDYAEKIYALLEEYVNDTRRTSRPSKTWDKKAEDLKDPLFYAKVQAKLYPS